MRELTDLEHRVITLWRGIDGLCFNRKLVGYVQVRDEATVAKLEASYTLLGCAWSTEVSAYIVKLSIWDMIKHAAYHSALIGLTAEVDGTFTLVDGYTFFPNDEED